jgi:hypothetical protein
LGNFYTNITLRAQRDEVIPLLSSLRRFAFVGFFDGFAVVCDRDCESQDLDVLASLAATLSKRLSRASLAVINHDDDVLLFGLYVDGALASEWGESRMASVPAPSTSKREFVRSVHSALGTAPVPRVSSSSLPWWLRLVMSRLAIMRHEQVAAELGLPAATVGSGFRYVERGDLPRARKDDFERV